MKSRKQQVLHYLMARLEPNINTKHLRLSMHPDMQKELLSLEERQVIYLIYLIYFEFFLNIMT